MTTEDPPSGGKQRVLTPVAVDDSKNTTRKIAERQSRRGCSGATRPSQSKKAKDRRTVDGARDSGSLKQPRPPEFGRARAFRTASVLDVPSHGASVDSSAADPIATMACSSSAGWASQLSGMPERCVDSYAQSENPPLDVDGPCVAVNQPGDRRLRLWGEDSETWDFFWALWQPPAASSGRHCHRSGVRRVWSVWVFGRVSRHVLCRW